MELIFILTYNCNFRCSYCDIDKRKEDMSASTLNASLRFLERHDFDIKKVKFFGGEPLMMKHQIRDIITHFPKKYTPNFYVTSNSTLVDDDFINLAKDHNLKVTFSIDGNKETTAENRKLVGGEKDLSEQIIENTKKYHKNIRINQVITSANSHLFFENFLFIYELGVREFNFLPEYYRLWSKQGLKNLQKGFEEIYDFYKQGNEMHLVNSENYSETSFFNVGIVIDTDGSIYGTNLILAGVFEKYKPELKIGHVDTGIEVDVHNREFQKKYIGLVEKFLAKEHSKEVLTSVKYVDLLLSNFVKKFEGI